MKFLIMLQLFVQEEYFLVSDSPVFSMPSSCLGRNNLLCCEFLFPPINGIPPSFPHPTLLPSQLPPAHLSLPSQNLGAFLILKL
jgi:hypothetical protein